MDIHIDSCLKHGCIKQMPMKIYRFMIHQDVLNVLCGHLHAFALGRWFVLVLF